MVLTLFHLRKKQLTSTHQNHKRKIIWISPKPRLEDQRRLTSQTIPHAQDHKSQRFLSHMRISEIKARWRNNRRHWIARMDHWRGFQSASKERSMSKWLLKSPKVFDIMRVLICWIKSKRSMRRILFLEKSMSSDIGIRSWHLHETFWSSWQLVNSVKT